MGPPAPEGWQVAGRRAGGRPARIPARAGVAAAATVIAAVAAGAAAATPVWGMPPAGGLSGVSAAATPAPTAGASPRPSAAVEVGRNLPVTSIDLRRQEANNSPLLRADPTEERFVVLASRIDATDFDCALHVSGDSGRSWWPVDPIGELPDGVDHCYAPDVVFDGQGRLYYLFVGLAGPGNRPVGVFLTTSEDRARTFSPPRRVLGAGNYQVDLAIDPDHGDRGRLYLAWLSTDEEPTAGGLPPAPNPLLAAHSDDGGQTWSDPVRLSGEDRPRALAPTLAVAGDGTLHAAYYDLKGDARDYRGLEGPVFDGGWELVVATSTDGGQTFSPGQVAADVHPHERPLLIFTLPPPALAVRPDRGLVVAWPDGRHGDADVLAARSGSEGGWQGPVRVNDDPVASGATQELARLATAPGGRLDAVWQDRRRHGSDLLVDTYLASSADGGASWSANVRVSTAPSDARTGARYAVPTAAGRVDYGSRLGLLSSDDRALVAWPDTRHVGVELSHQDIFAAAVQMAGRGGGTVGGLDQGLVVGAAGGLVALALAGVGLAVRRRRGHAARAGASGQAPDEHAQVIGGSPAPR